VLTFESPPGQVDFGKKTKGCLQSTLKIVHIKSPVSSGVCDIGSVDVKPLSGTVVTSTSNSSSSQVLLPTKDTVTLN